MIFWGKEKDGRKEPGTINWVNLRVHKLEQIKKPVRKNVDVNAICGYKIQRLAQL